MRVKSLEAVGSEAVAPNRGSVKVTEGTVRVLIIVDGRIGKRKV